MAALPPTPLPRRDEVIIAELVRQYASGESAAETARITLLEARVVALRGALLAAGIPVTFP